MRVAMIEIKSTMPSNIALIKYMGKSQLTSNQAANASISLTLPHLTSTCIVKENESNQDRFIVNEKTPLTTQEQQKALSHIERLKKHYQANDLHLDITSYNEFPASCGLASSASSMAAITKAVVTLICQKQQKPEPETQTLAQLSQLGSGSSCRSFFGPFALWHGNQKASLGCPINIHHRVIMLSSHEKKIKSSEAHKIISASQDLPQRIQRANKRVADLIPALVEGDWSAIKNLTEADSKDMHWLLENNGIYYRNAQVMDCFEKLKSFMQQKPDFLPITTMDAGPNIHVLLRDFDVPYFDQFLKTYALTEVLA